MLPAGPHRADLLEHARSLSVDVRFGVELTGLVDDAAGVHAQLRNRATGAVTRVHARFAVGADGPRSRKMSLAAWRQLRDMKGSALVEAMSPLGLAIYARTCGWTLARAHARSGDPLAIAEYLGDDDAFDR